MSEEPATNRIDPAVDEGGDDSPPSSVSAQVARNRPPLIEADPVEQAVEALAEVLPTGDRERTRQIVQTLMAWSGPVPPPGELREYGEVAPGAIEAILADFQRGSEVAAEIARHSDEHYRP